MSAEPSPDPRFSLANERTFLAWIRTALALLAAAAGLTVVDVSWPVALVRTIACVLAAAGGASALLAWRRWRTVETAIAAGRTAPVPGAAVIVGVSAAIAGIAVVLVVLIAVAA